jgi:hydroxyacylglutathione hydrolase
MPASPHHPPAPAAFRPFGVDGLVRVATCTLGPFQTNCSIVAVGQRCWIIDASFEPSPLIELVRVHELIPEALLLTHAHVDHIAGVEEVRRAFPGLAVSIHEAERNWLGDSVANLSAAMGSPVHARPAETLLKDGDTRTLGGTHWQVLHTPGHSPGSVAFWCPAAKVIISGDALFSGSIGRTDFPGSDFEILAKSIRTKLYTLPHETVVLPGHGPATTIGEEARSNPYVRA